jgi:hypothetical protein
MIEPRWGCTSWEGDHKETVYVVCVFVSKQEEQDSSHPFEIWRSFEIARNRQETTCRYHGLCSAYADDMTVQELLHPEIFQPFLYSHSALSR